MQEKHLTIHLLWAATQLLVTRFKPWLPSGWVLFQRNENIGPILHILFVWYEIGEIGKGNLKWNLNEMK